MSPPGARRAAALVSLLTVLAAASACDSSSAVAGRGSPGSTPSPGSSSPARSGEAAELPDFCEALPRSRASSFVAGVRAERDHGQGSTGPEETCTWERDLDDGQIALRVSVHGRLMTGSDGTTGTEQAEDAVRGRSGEELHVSGVDHATLRAVLGPRVAGLVTVAVAAQRANVTVDVDYVILGEPLVRAKSEATAVTLAAVRSVQFG